MADEAGISGVMLNRDSNVETSGAENLYNQNRTLDQSEADMEKATAKEIDTLIDSHSIREMRAVVTAEGSYAVVAETLSGKQMMMYSKTGNVRSFVDLDRLINWCQKRGFYRVEVFSRHPEDEPEPV